MEGNAPATRTRRTRWAAGLTAVATATVISALTLPAHAAPAQGRVLGTGDPGAVGDSFIVTLKGGTSALSDAAKELTAGYGVKIRHTYSKALNGYAVTADEARARRLAADPAVASVVQDTRVAFERTRPGPPWGLDRLDQRDLPLDASYAWPKTAGAGTTVYVIDTGIRVSHRDFGGRAFDGWDFVQDDAVAQDGNGHGTHVAGTAVGGRHGVAKKADVVAVRVLDDAGMGTTAQVIAGIDWVTRNARRPAVANMSLGGPGNAQLDAAVRNSVASGVTYTVAAGNDGLPAALYSPARVRQAITVGATDPEDKRASFSNWGTRIDLFAPGVDITSASYASDTGTATASGTSMASPHAAGAAALYLADHPSATPAQVGEALAGRAAPGRVTGEGGGSPDKLLQVDKG